MVKTFKVGDRVSWNSEAGRVPGKIVKVHRRNVNYKGYTHHASQAEPQYEIKSDKTDHIAVHKAAVLRRLNGVPSASSKAQR
jgi:hypothetical protein